MFMITPQVEDAKMFAANCIPENLSLTQASELPASGRGHRPQLPPPSNSSVLHHDFVTSMFILPALPPSTDYSLRVFLGLSSFCGPPHLKHLTVLFENPDDSISFFDYFSFPNLVRLLVDIFDWPDGALSALDNRSGFPLTELVLYSAQFDLQSLIDFLDANPDMVELGLRNFRDLRPMLGALTYCRASETVLVPDLERISIWSESHQLDEDNGDALVAMLESRWKPDVNPADSVVASHTNVTLDIPGSPSKRS
ncbi:hypothetical protein C8J57DRAFT_1245786 [Mycena rebaudengoi]|nr:hypothetical protein C8J57DRAFT_1245786 [Mycena rebaudengoi]